MAINDAWLAAYPDLGVGRPLAAALDGPDAERLAEWLRPPLPADGIRLAAAPGHGSGFTGLRLGEEGVGALVWSGGDEEAQRNLPMGQAVKLLSSIREAILVVSNGIVEWSNEAGSQLLGRTREETVGARLFDFVHEEDRHRVEGYHHKRMTGEQVPRWYRLRMVHAGGEVRWFEARVERTEWHGRAAALSLLHDVTARQRFEEALIASESRLSDLYENAPIGIFQISMEDRIVGINRFCLRLLGYENHEKDFQDVRGLPDLWFTRPEDRKWIAARLREDGALHNHEVLLRRRDGSHFAASINARLVRDFEGRIRYVEGFVEDVTERRRAAEKLAAAAAEWSSLFDAVSDRVTILTTGLAVARANRAAIEAYAPHPVVGNFCHMAFFSKSVPFSGCPALKVLETRRPERLELPPDMTGGRWIEERVYPILGSDGQVRQMVHLARDITAEKEAQEAMREARAMAEAANRAQVEFLTNISHELRTPLNPILGMTDLLLETVSDPEQADLLHMIRDSAGVLLSRINDLILMSRLVAGRMAPSPEPLDTYAALTAVAGALRSRAEAKGLHLVVGPAPPLPYLAECDPHLIHTILLKLTDNAIKFTADGEVTLSLDVSAEGAGEVGYTVEDTGLGMSDEMRHRVFDYFRQADGSTTRQHGGMGLGLSIVKEMVSLLHGRLDLDSAPGRGTRIRVILPCRLLTL